MVIRRVARILILVQIDEAGGKRILRRVEYRDTAALELGHVFGIEQQIPAVDRRVLAENLRDPRCVVSKAVGSHDHGTVYWLPGSAPPRVSSAPDRDSPGSGSCSCRASDTRRPESVCRHKSTTVRRCRSPRPQQLRLQRFVAIVDVVARMRPRLLHEAGDGVIGDVVRPVVDVQFLGVDDGRAEAKVSATAKAEASGVSDGS